MKKILVYFLSLPILLMACVTAPIFLVVFLICSPLFLLFDLIDILQGRGSSFFKMVREMILTPFEIWLDIVE